MVEWEGLLVALLALGVYINTLGHDFVYDDNRAVLTNPDIQVSSPLLNIFRNDFWGTSLSSSNSHGSYRPLCTLTFRLNHWMSGFQPLGFHLTNVALHGLATALVLKTARVLLPGRAPAIAAALFAVHPIHVEAVAGIVGRADVLAAIFFCSSFLCYVEHLKKRDLSFISNISTKKDILLRTKFTSRKNAPTKKFEEKVVTITESSSQSNQLYISFESEQVYLILFLVFAVCAMLSKEPSVTVIPLAVCFDVILHLRSTRFLKLKPCVISSASASLVAFLIIVLARLYIMGFHTSSFSKADNPTAKEPLFLTRTLTFLYLPVFNFFLLVCPKWLSFDWSMEAIPKVSSILDYRFLFAVVFYYTIYRTTSSALGLHRNKIPKSCANLKICKLCNLSSVNEHYAPCRAVNNNNLPQQCDCWSPMSHPLPTRLTVTMCLAFTVLPFLPASNLLFYVGFVVAERVLYIPSVGFCMLVALGLHVLWASHKTLTAGGYILLVVALGTRTLQRNADWRSEESLYRSALHINPAKAYGNLGSVLSTAGRLVEAEEALRTALSHRPNMADVHHNLGNLLSRQLKYEEAVASYQMAIQYRPSLAVAHLNLAQRLEYLGRRVEAEAAYRRCSVLEVAGLKDPRAHEEARLSCVRGLAGLCAARDHHHHCQTETLTLLQDNIHQVGPSKEHGKHNALGISLHRSTLRTKMDGRNKTRILEAEEVFISALKEAPTDPGAYIKYGQLLARSGRQVEAASLFLKAAQLAPQQHALVTSAAIALRHAGRLGEAETLYLQARDLQPTDATSHSNLGAILHLQGKYQQAARSYREALRLSPGDHVTLTNLKKLRNLLSRNKS